MQTTYLSCAETAKLVRTQLKKHFAGVKFSVRSDTYSMGASIRVKWTDGPCTTAVDAVVQQFSGSKFDGMIDMKHSHTSWLNPDGTAVTASDPGSEGSMGVNPAVRNWMPDPDAKLVHFQADYIFTDRTISYALLKRAYDRLAAKGYPVEAVEISDGGVSWGGEIKLVDHSKPRGFDMERELWLAARKTHCCPAAKNSAKSA